MDIQGLITIRKDAEESIVDLLNSLEEQTIESGIDEFRGHRREEFIIKFDRYELLLDKNGKKEFTRVKLGIYIEDQDDSWLNSLKPVGDYLTVYDIDGEFIDEFITIKNIHIYEFTIEYWIEKLNKSVSENYYLEAAEEYKFVTYLNHSISLFQARNYPKTYHFLTKCLEFIAKKEKTVLTNEIFLEIAKDYLKYLYYYLKRKSFIEGNEKIEQYIRHRKRKN